MVNLKVKIPGLKLDNPIMPSPGGFGYKSFGHEWSKHYDLNILGSIITKAVTLKPKKGHSKPNWIKVDSGWLNAIGLANPGVDKFLKEKLPLLKKVFHKPIIVNIVGQAIEEYETLVEKLSSNPNVAALEINASCPNVNQGGIEFGLDAKLIEELTKRVKRISKVPIYVKLSPHASSIVEIAKAAARGGADAISMINTLKGMALDPITGKPKLSNKSGGLSGRGIKHIALFQVFQVAQAIDIPIIGMGGIESVQDVIDMMSVGATAVAIGSANYTNPMVCHDIIKELPHKLEELGINNINDIIGRSWK